MYFADFETTTNKINSNKSWVWMWGIKGLDPNYKMDVGSHMEGFLNWVANRKMTPIFFHNLSWDFNYIFKWLLDNGFRHIDTTEDPFYSPKENEFVWLCDHRGGIYNATVNWNGVLLDFYDSWKVLMSSVENLGLSIGKEKLQDKFDYDHYHKSVAEWCKEDYEYLERDIDIVIETFTKATSIVDRQMTRAGMAYEHFRKFYGERNFANDFGGKVWNYIERKMEYSNILQEWEWDLVTRSYQGGYTNWNKDITDIELETPNGISVDVNSLYPAVMEMYEMPYGRMLKTKPKDNHITLIVVHIYKAKKKDPKYPALFKEKSKKIDAKYLDEIEYEERVMWLDEFEYIKKYYNIEYNIFKEYYFKTKKVFDEWLAVLKENKINAIDPVERDFWKGIYNSLYGKFGQHKTSGSRIIVEDGKITKEIIGEKYLIDPNREYNIINGNVHYKDTGNKVTKLTNKIRYGLDKQFKHEAKFITGDRLKYMPIASWTTWLARRTLWDAIFANLEIWLYSDTDSCYYSGVPKGIDIHETRFGAWKTEHKFCKFKVLRAKCYMYQSTAEWKNGKWNEEDKLIKKISGVSKEGKDKINWENFFLGSVIKNAKRGTKNVDGGKFIIDSDYKLGKSIGTYTEKEENWQVETLARLKGKI